MTLDVVLPFVRHALQFGAGALVIYGLIDESTATSLVGAATTLFTFGWMFFDKKKAA